MVKNKDDIQREATKIIQSNRASLLLMGTGTGKTYTALSNMDGKILIVYAASPHYQNWLLEIEKWNIQKDITFTTYDSLHHLIGTKWDWICLDEAHHCSLLRLEKLQLIESKKYIYLSATVPKEKLQLLKELCPYKSYKYNLAESIDSGVLPQLDIRVINFRLDNTRRDLLYKKEKKTAKSNKVVNYNERFIKSDPLVNIHIRCTEQEYYNILCEEMEFWKSKFIQQRLEWQKAKWLRKGGERKDFLAGLKTNTAIQLVNSLVDKRFIVFTNSIEQCEKVAQGYPCVHSKNPDSLQIIDEFNNGTRDRLFNVRMLNEGMNLTQLDIAIIVALDGTELSGIQRIGRSTRSEKPIIYILRVINTQDHVYFDKLMSEIKQDYTIYEL